MMNSEGREQSIQCRQVGKKGVNTHQRLTQLWQTSGCGTRSICKEDAAEGKLFSRRLLLLLKAHWSHPTSAGEQKVRAQRGTQLHPQDMLPRWAQESAPAPPPQIHTWCFMLTLICHLPVQVSPGAPRLPSFCV